jgi:hypothetical protein
MGEDEDEIIPPEPVAQCSQCNQEIAIDPEVEKKSEGYLLYLLLGVVAVFALIFSISYFTDTKIIDVTSITGKTVTRASDERYDYNGLTFSKVDDIWYTDVLNKNKLYSIGFNFDPLSVLDINIQGKVSQSFTDSDVYYVTFDPTKENLAYTALASAELQLSMGRAMNLPLKAACAKNHTDCANVPIITCDNTEKPVFFIDEAEQTRVLFDGNCIIIQGKGKELVRAVDRLLYFWYGIIKG